MNESVSVRPARGGDISGIYQVTRRNWVEVFGQFLHAEAVDWDAEVPLAFRDWLQTVVSHESMSQLVAVTPTTIVGCAEFAWESEETAEFGAGNEAELKAIHVSPDYWGEGIGSALLSEGADTIPEQCSRISLSVLVDNERARGFYERKGFEQDGTTTTVFAGKEYTEAVYRRSR